MRPFNYTGVGQSVDFVIPKLVDHIQRKAYNIALGNLDVERDFSDVRGVVDAYARLLRCSEAIGETLNICSGRGYSLRDLLDLARRISGKALEVTVDPALVRENEVHSLYGDNSRLQARIGKLCMPPLSETLRWMLDA